MISKQMIDWGESGCSIREIGESSAQYGMTAFLYGMVTLSASKSPPIKNAGRSSGATS